MYGEDVPVCLGEAPRPGKHVHLSVISDCCSGRGGSSERAAVRSLKFLSSLRGVCSSPVTRFRGHMRRLGRRGGTERTPVGFAFCSSSHLYAASAGLQGGFNCTTLDGVCRRLRVSGFLVGERHRAGRRCSTGAVVGVLICTELLTPTSGGTSFRGHS